MRPEAVKSGVVFFARGLGDHVLVIPTLRALGRVFPGKLHLIADRCAPELFFGDAGLAAIHTVEMDYRRVSGRLFDVDAVAGLIGKQDLFISVMTGATAEWAALAGLTRPRWTVGLAQGFRTPVAVDPLAHIVDQQFAVARSFDPALRAEDFSQPFALPEESARFAGALRGRLGRRRLLVIHGETKPEKQWAPRRLRAVVRSFLTAHPEYLAVEICRDGSALGRTPLEDVLTLRGLPIASAFALVASADLLLCVDSVHLHVADLWRTPTVALFGPTSHTIWGARFNSNCTHLQADSMVSLRGAPVTAALDDMARKMAALRYRPLPLQGTAEATLALWK
jgi:ADP-heptose:LPS heptosyltransferase